MNKLALVMITKNEEKKIARCLESVFNIVDEIIIADTGSTDNTKLIASKFNAKIYDFKWDDDFSKARNFALSKSSCEWNLILDADEFIDNIDLESVLNFINHSKNCIGRVQIVSSFEQDNEIKQSIEFISRLIPKGIYYKGRIHEQVDSKFNRKTVDIIINHDGYLNTNKFDRNINLILKELETNKNDSYLLYQAGKTYYTNKMYVDANLYFDKLYNLINPDVDNFFKDYIILYLYSLIKTNDFSRGLKVIEDNLDVLNKYCDFYFVCGVFFTELVAFNTTEFICFFDNIEICYLNALNLGEGKNYNNIVGCGSFLASFNLGLFYELSNNKAKALEHYNHSYNLGYAPALAGISRVSK